MGLISMGVKLHHYRKMHPIPRLLVNNSEKMPRCCLGITTSDSVLLAAGNRPMRYAANCFFTPIPLQRTLKYL
jgi:hypothetical protein